MMCCAILDEVKKLTAIISLERKQSLPLMESPRPNSREGRFSVARECRLSSFETTCILKRHNAFILINEASVWD
jgi:hypothetical protein